MFNTYARFLRDYGTRGFNPYLEYMLFFSIMWMLIIAIKKVVIFPNKKSVKIYKIFVFIVFVITVSFGIYKHNHLSLLFKNIEDDREFAYELNKALKADYKPEYECADYYIAHVVEKVKIPGEKRKIVNDYFYKVDKVNTRNIQDVLAVFEQTNYASTSNFVHQINEPDYLKYMKDIERRNKKAKARANKVLKPKTVDNIKFKINKEDMVIFDIVSRGSDYKDTKDDLFSMKYLNSEYKNSLDTYWYNGILSNNTYRLHLNNNIELGKLQ